MATGTVSGKETAVKPPKTGFLSGSRGRVLRENITAYLFLAPAAILIFTFGIFPIFYASYVSLYKWRIRQGDYQGLSNFIEAMGDIAYIFFGFVVIAFLAIGIMTIIRAVREARENNIPLQYPALSLIPGTVISIGMILILLRFITFFTQEQAIEAGEARILGSVPLGILALIVGGGLSILVNRWQHRAAAKSEYSILPNFTQSAITAVVTIGIALILANFTINTLIESGTIGVTWLKIRAVLQGVAALVIAYFLWNWAMQQFDTRKLIVGLIAASIFIGGGVYLISIWPVVTTGSDPDFYLSFSVTVLYAIGAVPLQLAISLVLAYLLYQDLKGRGLFRVIFFVPYIAPTVAGAAVFQVLFSLRETSIANRFMQFITGNPDLQLRWLKEPGSVIANLGEAFGFGPSAAWEFGPSLALFVVIVFSIWRFVGYDTVIFLAGLGGIPSSLYEAAKIDGANRWHLFRHVTLPLLSPTTFFLSVISVLGTFKAFNTIWVLRDSSALGTVDTASIYFFETFNRGARFGYAASMAIVLFAVMLTLTIIQNRIAERRVFYG
ncbi:MAG: ABC transporter permease subunit [Chloroflexota bacterium]